MKKATDTQQGLKYLVLAIAVGVVVGFILSMAKKDPKKVKEWMKQNNIASDKPIHKMNERELNNALADALSSESYERAIELQKSLQSFEISKGFADDTLNSITV